MDGGSVPSRYGERYIITFIDDYSRFGITYFARNKSETFELFKANKARVETQHDKKIQTLRSDRGGEYLPNEFNAYCQERNKETANHPSDTSTIRSRRATQSNVS